MVRPWKTGTAAQRAKNLVVSSAGDLGTTTDTAELVVGDGVSTWGQLKRLVRVDEVTAAVQSYVSSLVVTNSSLTQLSIDSGFVWALTDANGRVGLGVRADGTVVGKIVVSAGSVDTAQLSANVQSLVAQVASGPESGYVWSIVDSAGRVAIGIRPDGTFDAAKSNLGVGVGSVTLAKLAAEVTSQLAATQTGSIHAVGDSLTAAGSGYGTLLAAEIGVPVVVNAIGGQGVESIAARQGGYPALCTVDQNTIPATGSVAVTLNVPPYTSAAGTGTSSGAGILAGVPGTLTRDNTTGLHTFTRTTAGAAPLWVSPGSPWIDATGSANRGSALIVDAGRNSFSTLAPQAVVDRIQKMVGHSWERRNRFLILEVYPATGETTPAAAGSTRDKLNALNALLQATWPANFVPLNAYLQGPALTDAGLTPTTQDTADIAAGLTPTSLRADNIHLNSTGNGLVAKYLARIMRQKGWFA